MDWDRGSQSLMRAGNPEISQDEDEIEVAKENSQGLPIIEVGDWEFTVIPIFEFVEFISSSSDTPI